MTTAQAIKKTKLTEDEVKCIQLTAYSVWCEIAYDALLGLADEKGKSVDEVTYSRAEAMEMALDAGRLEGLLRQNGKADLAAKFDALDYAEMQAIVRPAFPYARYGL